MAPEPARAAARFASVLALLLIAAAPAHALKVATWNLMGYENPGEGPGLPSPYISVRQANFRTVMAALDPDVLFTQEMNSAAAKDSFLLNVLGNVAPGQWAGSWIDVGTGEGMGFFWKPARCTITNQTAITTPGPRKVMLGVIKPVGYTKNGAWTRVYSVHFKASNTPADATTRGNEAATLRTTINNTSTVNIGTGFIVGGDTNIYDGTEAAYLRLTESQANNVGRSFDYLTMSAPWHVNPANAATYTQCPCNSCSVTGQSGGGLDDRFDLLLTSASLVDGGGLEYVAGSYTPFGNDGLHYNNDVNGGGFNNAVGLTVANALHDAADHLPVMITLQLPARYAVPSQFSFGDVIVDANLFLSLPVANAAVAPAASLAYTLGASAGFTAPGGSFTAAAGDPANLHWLGMDASVVGAMTGTLTLASNDNDTTSKAILLDGRVLAHAVPSLDSLTVTTAGALDLGDHPAGAFTDAPVRVFDQGYGPLQARLAVSGAVITGDARFSLAGGFSPVTFGSPGATWNVHFDDSSTLADSTYTATLTFTTVDEALPGAAGQPSLEVALRARVVAGSAGVDEGPRALRFYPPSPNPARGGALLAFDLPRAAHVALGIYDLSGRRVAALADGVLGQGHHSLRWNAQDGTGRAVAAGLYFVRFETAGLTRVSRLAVLQ
jgi:hypothetical protein